MNNKKHENRKIPALTDRQQDLVKTINSEAFSQKETLKRPLAEKGFDPALII